MLVYGARQVNQINFLLGAGVRQFSQTLPCHIIQANYWSLFFRGIANVFHFSPGSSLWKCHLFSSTLAKKYTAIYCVKEYAY